MAKNNTQSIDIDTSQVISTAEKIQASNKIMLQKAESILKTVEKLEDDWDSDVYKDFKKRVKKSGEVYQQYYNIIESAASLLKSAAQAYENTETQLKKAIE